MRIIVVGASGVIGAAVCAALEARHEIIRASRGGALAVDLSKPASIEAMFSSVPQVNAVVCAASNVPMAPFASQSDIDFRRSIEAKLFGQLAVARLASQHLLRGGSVTLTSGRFASYGPDMSAGALVNSGLEAFVKAASTEMPRDIRLNVVSPGWVEETVAKLGLHVSGTIAASDLAQIYVAAIEGTMTGEVL